MSYQAPRSPFTQLPPLRYAFPPGGHGPTSFHGDPNYNVDGRSSYGPRTDPVLPERRELIFPPLQSFGNPPRIEHAGPHPTQLDPATVPLPSAPDADLVNPPTIASAIGHTAAAKVGGSRRGKKQPPPATADTISSKAKGKRKRDDLDPDSDSSGSDTDRDVKRPTHGGRRQGAGNYKDIDLDALLDFVEEGKPTCQKSWLRVYELFKAWAKANNRPVRDAKSIEAKFKQLVKTTKPTGSGKRPPHVTRAKALERLLSEHAGALNLDDSDLDKQDRDGDDNDDDNKIRKVVVRSDKSEVQPRRNNRAAQSTELMQTLASALDPDLQRARDDERASRSLQNTHIFTLAQQLRDSQATNEKLRGDLDTSRERVYKLERSLDRARMKLEVIHGPRPKRLPTGRKYLPDIVRVKGKIKNVENYPEGGSYTTWVSDGSTATGWSDSDKENFDLRAYMQDQYDPNPPMYGRQRAQSPSSSSRCAQASSSPSRPDTLPSSSSSFSPLRPNTFKPSSRGGDQIFSSPRGSTFISSHKSPRKLVRSPEKHS